MRATLADDLAFGTKNEENVWTTIENALGTKLTRLGGYSPLDYTNEAKTIWAELKTRRIAHNQYPTALIGKNKVDFCDKENVAYYFVYSYNDGLWYIKYDKALFDTFRVEIEYERGWRPDASNAPSAVVHIPVEHLQKLEQRNGLLPNCML
jgi:hypothetical protein